MAGLFGAIAGGLERKGVAVLDQLPGFLMGAESKTGISITWSTALQVTAMYACCKVVGEGVAQTRCRLMRPRVGRAGADVASDHPLHRLLFLEPMKGQTAFSFWETIVFHMMLVGNAYAYINRVGDRVQELIIIEPGRVKVTQAADLSLSYEVTGADHRVRRFDQRDIWHLRGPSWNGWMGMECVKLAREALGLSLALESSHAMQHRDGLKSSGAYSIDGPLTPEQHQQITEWLKRHASRPGDPLILDRGAKWLAQQMTGVDAQHVETRRLQIEEVCRAARVMPIMIGMSDKTATYASSEQMFLAHSIHTLGPWVSRIEQAIEVALLSDAEQREGLFAKFNLSALMRGDYKSRQEGLQIQRRNGVISANEWRDLEDRNPRDDAGGDQFIVEGNMAVQDGRELVPVSAPAAAA